MQKNTQIFTTCSTGRTGLAAYAPIVANAFSAKIVAERLNAFIAQRERSVGHVDGAADVIAFVETFARTEGLESACELLNLAAKFGDYNIVEVYKDMLSSPCET